MIENRPTVRAYSRSSKANGGKSTMLTNTIILRYLRNAICQNCTTPWTKHHMIS
jgi:hypothetical protein